MYVRYVRYVRVVSCKLAVNSFPLSLVFLELLIGQRHVITSQIQEPFIRSMQLPIYFQSEFNANSVPAVTSVANHNHGLKDGVFFIVPLFCPPDDAIIFLTYAYTYVERK